jgi:hypothetical protein
MVAQQQRFTDKVVIITGQNHTTLLSSVNNDKLDDEHCHASFSRLKFGHWPRRGRGVREGGSIGGDPRPESGQIGCE